MSYLSKRLVCPICLIVEAKSGTLFRLSHFAHISKINRAGTADSPKQSQHGL